MMTNSLLALFDKTAEKICDDYCKHPSRKDVDEDTLSEICEECPITKTFKEIYGYE